MAAPDAATGCLPARSKDASFSTDWWAGALLTLTDELYSSKIEKRSATVWRRSKFLRHRTRFEMQTILAGRIVGF
jgi:hypothetical protein